MIILDGYGGVAWNHTLRGNFSEKDVIILMNDLCIDLKGENDRIC